MLGGVKVQGGKSVYIGCKGRTLKDFYKASSKCSRICSLLEMKRGGRLW